MKPLITNQKELAQTPQRLDALAILSAGFEAVRTEGVVKRAISLENGILRIAHRQMDISIFDRIFVIGFGKASAEAGKALEDLLGDAITDGVIISTTIPQLQRIRGFIGTHPIPTEQNRHATKEILTLLQTVTEKDLVLFLISGGGSALLCDPYEATCSEFGRITDALLKSGASIEEINTVRKHLSRVHGGHLAVASRPARVISLIFSDVPSNDLSKIASGPTVLDTTTIMDATHILEKYAILSVCRLPSCELTETPKNPADFEHVENILLCSNEVAAKAMENEAKKRGYIASIKTTELSGEAKEIGKHLLRDAKTGEAHIYAGELSVTVQESAHGIGGRNQEAVLASLPLIKNGQLFLACASDGIDNSPAAGAIADALTVQHVKEQRLSIQEALHEHNSYPFFQQLGDAIQTGPTGMNISDLFLVLGEKKGDQ